MEADKIEAVTGDGKHTDDIALLSRFQLETKAEPRKYKVKYIASRQLYALRKVFMRIY